MSNVIKYVRSMSMIMKHEIIMSNVDESYVNEVMNVMFLVKGNS